MLHVSLLGEQAIIDDATGSVRTRSSRTVALLAFLAAHAGAPQPRQRIAGQFWPDSTDAQALTNLRRELHHLRQALGDEPSLVVTTRDLYWQDTTTCRVDIRTFDMERTAALAAEAADDSDGVLAHASVAIGEYRGDLLPGVYDDWLLEARSELERQCVGLCDLACATRRRTGDLTGAVDAARRRLQLAPLEETGYRTLMQLQADLGDRAGAVSTYHHCASILERELGVSPDPATEQTFQRIMAQADPAGARATPVESAVGRSGFATTELVGRSADLGALQDLYRSTAPGRAGLALVSGGAGVGKTRLVAEVARVRATAGRRGGRYSVLREVGPPRAGASCRLDTQPRCPVCDGYPGPGLARGGGQAGAARGPGRSQGRGSRSIADAWQRLRFFEGLARALIAVGRPVMLVLDNMQWCDQETLAFISFCLALAEEAPVLIVGTIRNDSLLEDNELADWIVRMRTTGLLTELSLSPLEAHDTARLAEAAGGRPLPESDAILLQATTGGFPLFVIEAVRAAADRGSTSLPASGLTAVLRNRLDQATAEAREIAGLAAAVGTNFTLDLLTEASDLEAGVVVAAVDELWRRRIMHVFRDGYDFSHDLLRDAAYAQVSPPKRWLLHRRIAQAIELLHSDDFDLVSAQLAEQYARGGQTARAVTYYRRAADVAASRFAHAEAIRLHKEALSIVRGLPAGTDKDRQELAVLEGMAAPLNARSGYSSLELQHTLERTIALAESLGRRDSTLTGMVALWATQFVQGRTTDGYRTATRALALVDPDSELSGPAHFAVGGSAVSLGMPAQGLRHLELAVRLASGSVWLSVGTRADVHATAWSAHAHWLLGSDARALAACHDAIKLARVVDHPYCLAVALAYGAITHQMCGDLPCAHRHRRRAERAVR